MIHSKSGENHPRTSTVMASNCNCDPKKLSLTGRRRQQCRMVSLSVAILAATVCLLSSSAPPISAQFLFSYEISPESDDSRAPKSSLFDPSSFKIVTPSQLQSSYQKIAAQIDSPANAQRAPQLPLTQSSLIGGADGPNSANDLPAPPPPPPPPSPASVQSSPGQQQQQSSLLKQTSAAIQSLAELFNLAPSSSPSPLSSLGAPNVDRGNHQFQQAADQQAAEVRSLHEHWTQQQQRSHQLGTSAPVAGTGADSQPALASFAATTTPTSTSLQFQQQPQQFQPQQQQSSQTNPQASYWLTANPLGASGEANYLVQIRPESSPLKQSVVSSSSASTGSPLVATLDDNSAPTAARLDGEQQQQQQFQRPKSNNLAQSSFLATPTSYYPPNQVEARFESASASSSPASNEIESPPVRSLAQQQQPPVQVRTAPRPQFLRAPSEDLLGQSVQLQPPANMPEHFNAPQLSVHLPAKAHKSAEDTLISFRQQQQLIGNQNTNSNSNHNNVNSNTEGAANTNANINRQRQSNKEQFFRANVLQTSSQAQQPQLQPAVNQPQQQQQQSPVLQDIPKVSPQIYESFLLQQRDQHEKHMELLKQQQEINKLMEQRQKQQELEQQKKKRKKEELEREIAKKKSAARELELARKLKLEMEERETRRRRDEEERKRAEEQRYREYLEQERERERKLQLERKRQAELKEAQELKAKLEREEREQAESRRRKEAEEAKYANYLRQQEELKKLLELKAKEDEARQVRQRQVAALQQARANQQATASSRASAAQRFAANERRERPAAAGLGSWGAPLKIRGQVLPAESPTGEQGSSSPVSPASAAIASNQQVTTTQASSSSSSSSSPANQGEPAHHGRPTRVRVRTQQQVQRANRQRGSNATASAAADEKLIRQKIPLYSGPGQYGLYRGSDNSSALAADLAALLGSVTLPSSTTTTTSSSGSATSSTPDPIGSDSLAEQQSSSLSPLLQKQSFGAEQSAPSSGSPASGGEPFAFDDDVPRRPARELLGANRQTAQSQLRPTTISFPVASSSSQREHRQVSASNETQARPATVSAANSRSAHIGLASLPPDSDNDGIPGRAGVEYPVLSAVPPTSFSCSKQPLNGYYADTETACQVVHLCQAGVQSSILCPNGTIFNQEKFSCQWWYEVNCSRAPNFYQLNDNLYKSTPLPANDDTNQRTSAVMRADSAQASRRKLAKKVNSTGSNHLAAAAASSS